MTSEELLTRVDAFLTSYRGAFDRGDVAAVAAHFGEPVHVASDTGSGVRLSALPAARGET